MKVDRRSALGLGLAGMGSLGAPAAAMRAKRDGIFAIGDLRICALLRPLALGRTNPRFSWTMVSEVPGLRQHAYRILVARSAEDLAAGRDLVWDSGKVVSDRSFDIVYEGASLPARSHFWWRVELWSSADVAPVVSRPDYWETGLAAPEDWSARWLACETETARLDREAGLHWISASPAHKVNQIAQFRSEIEVAKATPSQLLLAASDLSGVWLNGEPLAAPDDEKPAWTTMTVYPLPLRKGRNILAVAVKRVSGLSVAGGAMAAIVRLGGPAGRRLTTRDGWKFSLDAPAGWQGRDFDDAGWAMATAAPRKPVGEPWPTYPANFLRREFTPSKPVRSARLYATALGVYEVLINGTRVGDARMAPQYTNPSRHILYQAYDVTQLVSAGANAIGFWVGDGWYGSEYSQGARFTFGPAPCRMMAQLELIYEDGTSELVATGDGWTTAPSPILASEIYDGEVYDARLEQPGWAKAGFKGEGWRAAGLAEPPALPVEPELCPPVRVTQTLAPKKVSEPRSGTFVIDFGQNFAGWLQLHVRGAAGTRIDMRFGEVLGSDGLVDQANLRSAAAHDVYVLKGDGEEVWEPRFTYHGFRYVEIQGLPVAPTSATLQARVAHTDLAVTGNLRVGDPVIQKFWQNALWSQRSNFFGLPTDCPQRDERLGWMGDAQVFWPAAAFNMDIEAYTARVMRDVRHDQAKRGGFPDVIPPFSPGLSMSSPGWADAGIILPYTAWRQYGDTAVIADNWEAMGRYMDWIQRANPNLLWKKSRGADYGDWLSVDAKNPQEATTPKDLIGTAYWAADADMLAQMADAIGRKSDMLRYRKLFEDIRTAFNKAYVQPDGTVGNGSQTSHVLAIRFGLLTDAGRTEAGRRLAADITRRGNTLSTGFLGTPHILDALADAGQEQMAITLLQQRAYPSWGYMVEKGATTMWERWNSDRGDVSMNSYNHYAFGSIGAFLFRRIAGIAPAEPGFRRIRIAPILDPRLGHGGGDYRSPVGMVRTDWRYSDDVLTLNVSIPTNSSAVVALPAPRGRISKDARPLARAAITKVSGNVLTEVEVGPGAHVFQVPASMIVLPG